jgi:hypothetical protein
LDHFISGQTYLKGLTLAKNKLQTFFLAELRFFQIQKLVILKTEPD